MLQEILSKAESFRLNQQKFFEDCPFFPEIKTHRVGESELWVGTIKRVLHEGKWYRWEFLDIDYSCDAFEGDNGLKAIKRLLVQIHLTDVYGKVQPDLTVDGKALFELDDNQHDEFYRMRKYLPPAQKVKKS